MLSGMGVDVFGLENRYSFILISLVILDERNVSMIKFQLPFTILKRRSWDALKREHSISTSFLELYTRPSVPDSTCACCAECIIFSMDRALQLHALLSSYYEQVLHPVPVRVLYRASSPEHQRAYQEVFSIFSDRPILAIAQESKESFRTQLISILESIGTGKVFFLVDDIIFTEKVDLHDFIKVDTRTTVATLRLGANLNRTYTLQRGQKLPPFIELTTQGNDKLCWIWEKGEWDWGYPLSLDGHLFSTRELLILSKHLPFNSPNTFEANLQAYSKYFTGRYGICYKKSRILNIPINRVQNDNTNIHGTIHQDHLLKQWNQGLQMDYRALFGFVNESAHQEVAIPYMKRT